MVSTETYGEYLQQLLNGNRTECVKIFQHLLDLKMPLDHIYENLIQKSMYDVGKLWETNKISVAAEHLCTALTENLLHLTYPLLFSAQQTRGKAVISCSPNEYHQLGGRIVADYITYKGWDCRFLGANTPLDDLITYLSNEKPVFLGLSAGTALSLDNLKRDAEKIKQRFPDIDIIAGGQAFCHARDDHFSESFRYIGSMNALESYLESFR